MKAAVYTRYGPPDVVVQIKDVEKPVLKDNEVLLKVRAASVNPLDCALPKGGARLVTGLRNPKVTRLGVDAAGQVEAVGRDVTQFKPGDEVFGVCIRDPHASSVKVWVSQGAFAEYACAPESTLFLKPDNVTYEQAASSPVAAFTALQGLRGEGGIKNGQRVLINGAAGGVGTFAVQIAKSFGAAVTGVCSTKNVEMVRSIGADHVIDYTREDFTKNERRYDLLLDCVGNHSLSACRRVLNPKGICVMVGDQRGRAMIGILARLIAALVLSRFVSQKFVTFLARPNKDDLIIMHDLMKAGMVTPVIDKIYTLSQVASAIRHVEERRARGKVVMRLASNSRS
jgi:NADPH:quinone reductase-like Zn-dependent oxidoreductase